MDMTPSAKRRGWREKKTGDDVPKKSTKKEWKHDRRRDITEKRKS